jgi:hypothetical protein
MAELSDVIEALIGLGWRKDLDRESHTVIMQMLNCSAVEAKTTLEQLYVKRGLIRQVSSNAEELDVFSPKPVDRWRWIAA